MDAAQWGENEESGEVGMIQMSAAIVDPGTMVIHLHHTPVEENVFNYAIK